MKLKKILALFLIVVFFTACAGTPPRPIPPYEYGDEKKSCETIYSEAADCKAQILALEEQRNGKIAGNFIIAAIGIVLFFPVLFALNTRSDERTEQRGFAKRQETLLRIATDNECEWVQDETKLAELAFPEIPEEIPPQPNDSVHRSNY